MPNIFSLRSVLWCSYFLLLTFLTACAAPQPRALAVASQPEAAQPTRLLDDRPLRQSFVAPPGGVDEIELVLVVPEGTPMLAARPITWRVSNSPQTVVHEGQVETAGLLHNAPLRLRFEALAAGQPMELAVTAPAEARIALWASAGDRYADGTILDNDLSNNVDLTFTLRSHEEPLTVWRGVVAAAERWRGVALWLPLLVLAPGWLLAWLARPGDGRPMLPLVGALSLALAPLVYLWLGLAGLRLYEPLAQSGFQASALALALFMLRDGARAQAAWRTPWRGSLALLALAVVAAIATWLLATRLLIAPPGQSAVASGLLAQGLVRDGLLGALDAPLPPAALAATLAQLSSQAMPATLLLGSVLLAVALVPGLYALGTEASRHPQAALWLVPLAWLWPTPWQALARGDLLTLYGLALTLAALALGLRALGATERPWGTVLLAAVPLAALGLAQGIAALAAWAIALVWALGARGPRAVTVAGEMGGASGELAGRIPAIAAVLARALVWLAAATALLVPAWLLGFEPFFRGVAVWAEYGLPLAALGLAAMAGWLARRAGAARYAVTLLALLALPALGWWRSAPLPASPSLTTNSVAVFDWARESTPGNTLFLVNVTPDGATFQATDAGAWLPLYARRATVLQRDIAPDLLARAMQPDALADPQLRQALQAAGVTHVYVNETSAPLRIADFQGKEWARQVYQVGADAVFEFVTPVDPQSRHAPPALFGTNVAALADGGRKRWL